MSENREHTTIGRDVPIACNLSGAEQATRRDEVAGIFSHAEKVNELADGYAFRYPGSGDWAAKLLSFIIAERSCCPFFTFELIFEVDEGPIWLHLRGAEGVRDFIKAELIAP